MTKIKALTFSIILFLISGCSALDVYRNADKPVDWTGKDNWGFLSVKNNGGRVLVSPRPRDSEVSAALSSVNYNARSQILLKPGINDINVYAMNGSLNAVFTIKNIKIESNGKYHLEYEFEGDSIKTKVVDITK